MAGAFSIIAPYSSRDNQEALSINGQYNDLLPLFEIFCECVDSVGIISAFNNLKWELKEWVDHLLPMDVSSACYKIIKLIDSRCVGERFWGLKEPGEIIEFECLNSKSTSEEYLIVPLLNNSIINEFNSSMINKLKLRELRKRIAIKQPSTLQGYIKYHLILKRNEISKNPRFYIPYNSNTICRAIIEKNYVITFALFPLVSIAGQDIFFIEYDERSDGKFFSINGFRDNNEQVLFDRFLEALDICTKCQVDFAIFPELLCSDKIVKAVSDYILSGDHTNFPYLLWLGSAWKDNTNKCSVIDCYGKLVFEHYKQQPFEDNNGFVESLRASDNTSHILDINGVGRIMTGICKDITDIDLISIIEKLCADFFMLPTFSSSLDIARVPLNISKEWTTVLCSNTCAARHPREGAVSFISVPAKIKNTAEARLYSFPDSHSCSECIAPCTGFIVKVKYKNPEKYIEGGFSPEIEFIK